MLAALLINIFTVVSPLFVMNVYDRVVPNNAEVTLWVLAIGVLIIFTFDLLLRFLRGYLIDVCGKKADIVMASSLFQHVLGIQLINKPASVGAFANNLREFETVRDFFTSATLTTLIDLPFLIIYLIFTWYIGGVIVLVPLLAIPIVLITAYLIEVPLRHNVQAALQEAAQKNAVLVEAVSGIETIKTLGAESILQHKWEQRVGRAAKLGLQSRFLSAAVINITYYVQQLVTIGTVIVGVYAIEQGSLTLGGLIACNILAGRTLAPLGQFANLLTRLQQTKAALEGLNKIMALPLERPPNKHFLQRPAFQGEIEFKNVTFQYPYQQTKALDNVSFKINKGEKVAIVGRIGSGKSTLQKLLLGLYQPQQGAIYIDGIDLTQIDPIDLRKSIGYAPQDSLLFAGNVRDNIAMAQPWADDAAILRAAKLAGVDNFVSRHPAGYNLPVGERGEGLSGGQRQAIAIARALLSNPNILLLDEPTSATDERSEQELIHQLKNYLGDKTVIVVTHKASLLALVDRLIILDNSKIALDGPKEKLLKPTAEPKKAEGNQS